MSGGDKFRIAGPDLFTVESVNKPDARELKRHVARAVCVIVKIMRKYGIERVEV